MQSLRTKKRAIGNLKQKAEMETYTETWGDIIEKMY